MPYRETNVTTVFVVDDQDIPREMVSDLVEAIGEHVKVLQFDNAADVLATALQTPPDLLVTDYRMPEMDGMELIKAFRSLDTCKQVPIIMLTSIDDRSIRIDALNAGAMDFLTKPADPLEVKVRCKNLLIIREQQLKLHDRAKWLESKYVSEVQAERARRKEAIMLLARAGERRDNETGLHLIRMAKYSRVIAEAMGVTSERCELIEDAAPLHDIGKLGVPDDVLRKKGRLTPSEWETIKKHTIDGYSILRLEHRGIKRFPEVEMGAMIARSHHEKYDGSGYPEGLYGEQIPRPARIIAVADVFDALMSERPYKKPWPLDTALNYLKSERGKHFDPKCVNAFFSKIGDIKAIHNDYSDRART